ncbi:dephospho-CoA kinase [Thiospirillum jenense]|uniref:Dephospho-CoA kinase n=1 Tax=Thiospirillum jenense TaxID=1653858 RepID=A0A839HDK5_9GAMM|nr:dephospho-CoA kinase [Thiospirillum jenense]MBB1127015.1 dephospho-CoA kinase [Thiospirillum jenense]
MFTVALTGGIGSGKTTVAEEFAQRGIAVIDADVISHQLTAIDGAAFPMIKAAFGAQIFNSNGELNRATLRQQIFNDERARSQLESILHPLIFAEMQMQLTRVRSAYAMLVIPLLFETYQQAIADHILVVDIPEALQIERVQLRSGLSLNMIQQIMARQVSRETRLAGAMTVIDNSGELAALAEQITRLHAYYCGLAGKEKRTANAFFCKKRIHN